LDELVAGVSPGLGLRLKELVRDLANAEVVLREG
jgi:hypothetical protein